MAARSPLSFKFTKAQFFDRPVVDDLSKRARGVLSRFGTYVRRHARKALAKRYAKPVESAWQLPTEQRRSYHIRMEQWRRRQGRDAGGRFAKQIGVRPSLPDQISQPGDLPFIRKRLYAPFKGKSPLRELIYFAYDKEEQAVVIGPEQFTVGTKGVATHALEHGGESYRIGYGGKRRTFRVQARPFMNPSFEANLARLREWKRGVF